MTTLSGYHRTKDFSCVAPGLNEELDAIANCGDAIVNPATGKWFSNDCPPARIHRITDRVLIGAATVASCDNPETTRDWLEIAVPSTASQAMVVALSPNGRIAMLAGTRTSDAGITGDEDGCAGVSVVINDACGEAKQVGFGHYFESQQLPGAGFTASIEADSVNLSGVVSPLNPYSMFQDSTVNIWLGAGGNRPGSINSSAAIGIVQNGAKYEKGIVFQTGSISSNEAIAFASGHAIQWWGADGVPTSFVQSTTHSTPGGIVFADRGIYFGNNGATVGGFLVPYVDGAVDFVTAIGAKAGGFVQVAADGQDANIGLALTPKGNGLLILGGINQTPSGAPINGLEVINARDGQTYVIPLYRKV